MQEQYGLRGGLAVDDAVEEFLAVGPAEADEFAGAVDVALEDADGVVEVVGGLEGPGFVDADDFQIVGLGAVMVTLGAPGGGGCLEALDVDLALGVEVEIEDEAVVEVATGLFGGMGQDEG